MIAKFISALLYCLVDSRDDSYDYDDHENCYASRVYKEDVEWSKRRAQGPTEEEWWSAIK